jgi:GAF domain-containing protein
MVVDEEQSEPLGAAGGVSPAPLGALVAGGRAVVEAPTLVAALRRILAGGAGVLDAGALIARVLDDEGRLVARAVHAPSTALAAELDGTAVSADDVADVAIGTLERAPAVVRAAAERVGAAGVLVVPVTARDRLVGTLEVLWRTSPTGRSQETLARLIADQVGAAIVAFGAQKENGAGSRNSTLDLAGDALAAGVEPSRAANEIARLAVRASGARAARVWRPAASGLQEHAAFGDPLTPGELAWSREVASGVFAAGTRVSVVESAGDGAEVTALTLLLGQPGSHVLQLLFERRSAPRPEDAERIAAFALRASAALHASERSGAVEEELEQMRTLLSVVAQVNADLSLTRTLATFVDRVAELLDVERVCVYLREDGRLVPAAERGLAGPHAPVAERLLTLALGRPPAQGVLEVESAGADPRLAAVRGELAETGIETAIAIPLRVPDEVTGLLALYPSRLRRLSASESALVTALAARLAVALQNARLHQEATRLGTELEGVLALERQAASQLRALYEISRSFSESLSLEETVEAVVTAVVDLLGVDAAVIRMPDERGELLVPARIRSSASRAAVSSGWGRR